MVFFFLKTSIPERFVSYGLARRAKPSGDAHGPGTVHPDHPGRTAASDVSCLLHPSDAADDLPSVDRVRRRIR